MSIMTDAGTILSALFSGDIDFQTVNAFRSNAAWLVFGPITALAAVGMYYVYRAVPFLDRHLERTIVVWTYIVIAGIIFVGVLQRFLPFLPGQPPWSTTVPPLLFMVMAWFGCSFNVRLRTHLSFNEFRTKMGPGGQMMALSLDAFLWFVFCLIVVVTTARVTVNAISNFMIVPGTNDLMLWWFVITVPIAFALMAARVLQNLIDDIGRYRRGDPLIEQSVIGGDV